MSTEQKNTQVDKLKGLQLVEAQMKQAPTLRTALMLPFVKERYISNYKAITGREDGENKFMDDLAILNEMAMENPKIAECDRLSVGIALMKVGTTGLSLKAQGHLYMVPINKMLKCQIGAHGHREMLRQMKEVKFVHEAVVVVEGDIFKVDKLNNRIIQHESTDKSIKQITKLEDIKASYVRMEYTDGRVVDMIVPYEDLLKARGASKNKGEGNVWVTWTAEMCKKVSYHRLFKIYYRYPDRVVILPGMEEEEETKDTAHKEVTDDFMSTAESSVPESEAHTQEATVVDKDKDFMS